MPEKVKEIYYRLEEKYYSLLDKINNVVPVYKLTDRIDKVLPSFLLVLSVIFVLVFFGSLMWLGLLGGGTPVELQFLLTDTDGTELEGIGLEVLVGGETTDLETNAFGETEAMETITGSEVIVRIEEDGFKKRTRTFTLSEETELPVKIELIREFEEETIERLIRLVSEDDPALLLSGEEFEVSFDCENSEATPPANITVVRGELTVNEPADCGGLIVTSVRYKGLGDKFGSLYDSVSLSGGTTTINLQELGSGSGEVRVKTYFDGEPVNGIYLELYAEYGLSTGHNGYTSNGEYTFTVAPGRYTIKAFDESGEFGAEEEYVYIEDSDFKEARIDLEKNIQGYVRIQVVEKESEDFVDGAQVTLLLGDSELFTKETNEADESIVEFPVSNADALYTIIIDHEDYLVEKRTDIEAELTQIELTKFTGANGATLNVTVLDQDRRAVRNARVALFRQEGIEIGFSLYKPTESITDLNGTAKFRRVGNGTYKAYAFKESNSGWSDPAEFTARSAEEFELIVAMQIPDGTLKVTVLDDERAGLPNSYITFYDKELEQEIGTYPVENADGSYEFLTRADKSIYFKVTKQGFAPQNSVSYRVAPEGTKEVIVEMENELLGDKIEADFLGLFKDGKKADNLAVGETYTAKLRLWLPEGEEIYEEGGIHLRAGKEVYLENDLLLIKSVNDSDAVVKKYSTFTGNDYPTDVESMTIGDAKWINVTWENLREGIYNLEFDVTVKQNAALNDKVIFYYRAWVKGEAGTQRLPQDLAPEGHGLYSAVKEKIFTVGHGTVCDELFCFYATITDRTEKITSTVSESFDAKIERAYELYFDLMNNHSSFIHDNANVRIENENKALEFYEYSLRNADNRPTEGVLFEEKHKLPWIDLGNFNPNAHIRGELIFTPKEPGDTSINVRIVSKNEVVFEKDILVSVEALKDFSLEFEPESIPAGIENEIEFTVMDAETNLEEGEALVKIMDRFGNVLDSGRTSDNMQDKGKVVLLVPGQEPGAELTFLVEKEDFNPFEEVVEVEENVIEFTPGSLGINLNTKKAVTRVEVFSIKNITNFDLQLTGLDVVIDSKDLLDEGAMEDWLYNNFVDISIPKDSSKEVQFKGILSREGEDHAQRETFKGTIDARVEANGSNWVYELPLTVSIGIGGEVEQPNCLSLTRQEWSTMTEGETVEVVFELENNCVIDGKPIDLHDLEAMVEWNSNHVGNYTVDLEGTQVDLRSGYFRRIMGLMEKDRILTGMIIFTPKGGMNGLSDAIIKFRARNKLEGKDEMLEDEMKTRIRVINLLDCVSFSRDVLNIPVNGSDSFTVKTNDCGGTTTFAFTSPLDLSKESIALGESETSQEIEVFAGAEDFAGQYPIWVEVKGAGQVMDREVKLIEARIQGDECIQLSKYELDVFDDPEIEFDGYDSLQVYNYCYEKPVKVTIKTKSLSRAMQEALFPVVMNIAMHYASKELSGEGDSSGEGGGDDTIEGISDIVTNDDTAVAAPKKGLPTTGLFVLDVFSLARLIPGMNKYISKIPGSGDIWAESFWLFAFETARRYMGQEDVEFTTTQKDLELKENEFDLLKALRPETMEEKIELIVEDSYTKYLPDQQQPIKVIELIFENTSGITQESPLHPIYRIFRTEGDKFEYHTEYEAEDFEKEGGFWTNFLPGKDPTMDLEKSLDIKSTEEVKNKFNLQFNSFNPREVTLPTGGLGFCRIGDKVGVTGEEHVPKIKLQWDWDLIKSDYVCDEGIEDYIYCDATQFSIEVLDKVQELAAENGLLEKFSLECPAGNCGTASTLNLGAWIKATEQERGAEFSETEKENATNLISFNAHLIRDGYSADFQKDFDDYAVTKAFFKTPSYYHNPANSKELRAYFSDRELFEFDYPGAPHVPLSEPGVYKAEIEILYNDDSWELFTGNQPNAKIVVHLTRVDRPVPPSPLYYMPFNGPVGIEASRTGYGINYIGDEMLVNETGEVAYTTDITNSNPVHTTTVKKVTDFRTINMDERGVLLKVQRNGNDQSSVMFAPNDATPVIMKLSDTGSESVYGFYSISVSGEAQNIGPNGLTRWSGLGKRCVDFGDRVTASYKETPDVHGASEKPNHSRDPFEYGFEPTDWYNPKRYGEVYMKTIFFTPWGLESTLTAKTFSEGLDFYAPGQREKENILLNGVMNQEITSIERIFELIAEETVCVSGHENDLLVEFWWNPEKVIESLDSTESSLSIEENCIK